MVLLGPGHCKAPRRDQPRGRGLEVPGAVVLPRLSQAVEWPPGGRVVWHGEGPTGGEGGLKALAKEGLDARAGIVPTADAEDQEPPSNRGMRNGARGEHNSQGAKNLWATGARRLAPHERQTRPRGGPIQ
jgi:hypothetical protein